MDIETVEREPLRYVYLRHVGPYPEIGATFGKMAAVAGAAGLLAKPDALFVGVYHDDPMTTPTEALRSDAGILVSEDATIPSGLEEGRIPGGRYARGVHRGSYSRMSESWGEFMGSVRASDSTLQIASPFELYISDMETTPEDELVTELYSAIV